MGISLGGFCWTAEQSRLMRTVRTARLPFAAGFSVALFCLLGRHACGVAPGRPAKAAAGIDLFSVPTRMSRYTVRHGAVLVTRPAACAFSSLSQICLSDAMMCLLRFCLAKACTLVLPGHQVRYMLMFIASTQATPHSGSSF